MAQERAAIDYEQCEKEFEGRNEVMQEIISALAQRSPQKLDEHGALTEVADELGLEVQRVYYVMENWQHLVRWRRNADADPLDPDAVKHAYDDEEMQDMAEDTVAAADGMGGVSVPIQLELDEVFRCMKMLPSDLGLKFYTQTLQMGDEIPRDQLTEVFKAKQD